MLPVLQVDKNIFGDVRQGKQLFHVTDYCYKSSSLIKLYSIRFHSGYMNFILDVTKRSTVAPKSSSKVITVFNSASKLPVFSRYVLLRKHSNEKSQF